MGRLSGKLFDWQSLLVGPGDHFVWQPPLSMTNATQIFGGRLLQSFIRTKKMTTLSDSHSVSGGTNLSQLCSDYHLDLSP